MRRSWRPRAARVGDLTWQASWQVRTRPSRALCAQSRVRGQEVVGRSPSALLLLPLPSSGTAAAGLLLLAERGQTPSRFEARGAMVSNGVRPGGSDTADTGEGLAPATTRPMW